MFYGKFFQSLLMVNFFQGKLNGIWKHKFVKELHVYLAEYVERALTPFLSSA